MRILVFGLPGAGKTAFAQALYNKVLSIHPVDWYNADAVREKYKDWDFTPTGRERQAKRMRSLCQISESNGKIAIADFVCPTQQGRQDFNPDILVFIDTITEGRFENTNKIFDRNCSPDYHVTNWDQEGEIIEQILHKLSSLGK